MSYPDKVPADHQSVLIWRSILFMAFERSRGARAAILGRLRATPEPFQNAPPKPTAYLNVTVQPDGPLVDRFRAEIERLNGVVHVVPDEKSALEATLGILAGLPVVHSILAWDALPVAGLREAVTAKGYALTAPHARHGERQAALRAAEPASVGVTGVDGAFATTGTLALVTHAAQGRLASLLPPVHIALLPRHQLYPRLEDWLSGPGHDALKHSNSVVFITGPSRTSDIEMQTILGVHGPGQLHVIVFG
jgi:L-lactate dehydrogenase complex protein LldG